MGQPPHCDTALQRAAGKSSRHQLRSQSNRAAHLLAGVGAVPLVGQHNTRGVRRVLQDVVLGVRLRAGGAHAEQRVRSSAEARLHNNWRLPSPPVRKRHSGLHAAPTLPASMSAISRRMEIMASQKRSSSALLSDSVGSIMSVPAQQDQGHRGGEGW